MSTINFDATQVAPQQPMEAIPAGWYKAAVTDSVLEPTADGTGKRLKYEMTVLDGEFKGRKVFDGFNLKNKNAQTVEIAQQQLSGLCHATGVLRVQDSTQLHNIPVLVKVSLDAARTVDVANNTIDPRTKQPYAPDAAGTKTYEAQNRIKGFKNVNDGAPSASAPAAASAPVAPGWATAKPATPAPASAPAASAPVASTTSNALPPWEAAKAAPAATPAAAPAKPAPKGPKKPAAVKADDRKFFVYISDENMPLKTVAEIQADFAKGMPADTPLLLEKDIDSGEWKDAAGYGLDGASAPAASATPAPAADVPPWER